MDSIGRVSSKGQITIPRAVREALGLGQGDAVLFRVDGAQAVVTRIAQLDEIAGTFDVSAEQRNTPWKHIIEETHRARAAANR